MRQVFVTSHPAASANKYLLTVITIIIPIFSYLSFTVLLNISIKPPGLFILISSQASSASRGVRLGISSFKLIKKVIPTFYCSAQERAEIFQDSINRKR